MSSDPSDPCFFCCCCPQYDTDNEHCQQIDACNAEPIDLGYYLNDGPPSPPTPSTVDNLLYPTHYLSTLHPIVVQPPPNRSGAHRIRRLTHDQRFDTELGGVPPSSSGPVIYVVSNGILTAAPSNLPRWHSNSVGPGRAVRTTRARSRTVPRAPPGYSQTPPSRGGAETAEPPPYPEDNPPLSEVPAYPGRGDGTMSAPTFQRRDRARE